MFLILYSRSNQRIVKWVIVYLYNKRLGSYFNVTFTIEKNAPNIALKIEYFKSNQ